MMDPRHKQRIPTTKIRSIDGINAQQKSFDQNSVAPNKNSRKIKINFIFTIPVIAIVIAVCIGWWLIDKNQSPIPRNISHSVGFPIYYPDKPPQNFIIDKKSFVASNGIMAYEVRNGDQSITINEQSEPSPQPNLDELTMPTTQGSIGGTYQPPNANSFNGFVKVASPLGQAVQGFGQNHNPIVILTTDTTLVNMNGSRNLSPGLLLQTLATLKK